MLIMLNDFPKSFLPFTLIMLTIMLILCSSYIMQGITVTTLVEGICALNMSIQSI